MSLRLQERGRPLPPHDESFRSLMDRSISFAVKKRYTLPQLVVATFHSSSMLVRGRDSRRSFCDAVTIKSPLPGSGVREGHSLVHSTCYLGYLVPKYTIRPC